MGKYRVPEERYIRFSKLCKYNRNKGILTDLEGNPRGSTSSMYKSIYFKNKQTGKDESLLVHRLIYYIETGTLPIVIDHIDADTHNNHIGNLRSSDYKLNAINRERHKNKLMGKTLIKTSLDQNTLDKFSIIINKDGISMSDKIEFLIKQYIETK